MSTTDSAGTVPAAATPAAAEISNRAGAPSAIRNVLALCKKELAIYFATPIAYTMLAVVMAIGSFFFLRMVNQYQEVSMFYMRFNNPELMERFNFTDMIMAPLLANMGVIFIFVAPFLSMRLVAAEKAEHTFELLMTTPLTSWQITLGKYLAAVAMMAITVGLLMIFPFLLNGVAEGGSGVEWRTVMVGYLGLFLLGCFYMAIGLFISSVTDSQVVAALMTFVVLLALWIVSWAAPEAQEAWAKETINYVSSVTHLTNFVKGLINLKDVTYYLSLIGLGLFLTYRSIESERWS